MTITAHPEDIKAALRKRFGSVAAFERQRGLPEKSVNDVLRGRPSARVRRAIEDTLDTIAPAASESEVSDNSEAHADSHRLNAGVR